MAKQDAKPKKGNARFEDIAFDMDLGSFADLSLDLDADFETRYIKPPKSKKLEEFHLKYEDAQQLAKDLTFTKGDRYFAIVKGSFYFGDFIEALLTHNRWVCKEMTVSTLSFNQNNIDSLKNLMVFKYVNKLNIIISDYFYSHERHRLIRYMYEELDMDNRFQLAVVGSHCKITSFETYCGKKITIHGSSNFRSSGNLEQLVIEENETLYDFNRAYQSDILDRYKTIDKSIRHSKLWDLVTQKDK